MQSTSEGFLNIAELANQLRREKIFINSERLLLQNLNEEVEKNTLELLQAAWVCSQQRQNLTSLITSRCEADSVAACQRASQLEGTTFIDAHKVLKFKEVNILGELLGWLRDSPHLVALCLLLGEDHMPPNLPSSLVAGLYGSCRSAVDRTRFLAVLRSLIKHQLAPAPDPRKLFRTGKCALAQLFAVFRDGHTPARQFLVAALGGPIMSVLHEDEFFLDIDPDKAMERFSQADRQKKFGQTNSPEYMAKVGRYRKWTIQSLYNLTSQFIASLRDHWGTFPPSLAWIIQQIAHLMKQHSRSSERELNSLCADIVFTHFICPAVVRPETHGVVETPVSHIARSNLTQIAQILQVLALDNYQEVDPKARDLYAKFDKCCVASLLRWPGAAGAEPAPPPPDAALRTEPPAPRAIALYTQRDLHNTITFLKRISSKLNNNTPSVTSEEASSSSAGAVAEAAAYSEAGSEGSSSDEGCASDLAALLQSLEPNYKSRLHDLLRKTPELSVPSPPSPEKEPLTENGLTKRSILAKVQKPRIPRSASFNSPLNHQVNGDSKDEAIEHPVVLVIKLANSEEHDYVGMVPESKVLECYYGGSEAGDADETGSALAVAGPTTVQKRTRFSVSHDEVSLGNTSDNLEAVSEAASNHSVTSSLELEAEDQNDNLSDMVSANVSGRGSPNISGRETPSSQVTDGDAANEGGVRRMPPAPVSAVQAANAQKLLKQTRNDIEDKFCKFEIKKLLEGDETISIMSDTWSTDVLASDSETIGDAEQQPVAAHGATPGSSNAPDVSETASESAWSMDVLASDSDRNTEVDTDDCVSVAARSDTSWPRRPSHHEDPPPIGHVQTPKRPDLNSPRHTSRLTNRSGGGYLTATAQLSRGGELDIVSRGPRSPAHNFTTTIENRKSILVNGYPVMTCYANSAPESPSTSAPPPMPNDVFDYGEPSSSYGAPTESTLEGGNSDATSQWVDDSFPRAAATPPDADDTYDNANDNKSFDEFPNYNPPADELLDRSLNSSESSFNALSVSHYDRRFDSGVETDRPTESRSTITDLMTRMSSATISTSNLVNNITSRIVKSEIRTSVISISSSRIDKKNQPNMSSSQLSVNSAETSVSDKSSSQDVNSELVTERRVSPPPPPPPPAKPSTGAIPKSISFDATAEKSQRRRIRGEDGLASNLDELKNNVKRSGGNLLHRIKMFGQKGRHHTTNGNEVKVSEEEHRIEETLVRLEPAESSEDILAKYRRKSSADARARRAPRPAPHDPQLDRCEGVVDLNDPEVFNSMKRKLRLVLSNPDLHCVEYIPNRCTSTSLTEWIRAASACASTEESAAHAGELARVLAGSGANTARLAAALRADLAARRPYAAYLASCRAGLTHTLHVLNRQLRAVRAEATSTARTTASTRVIEQLERGSSLRRLHARHSRRDNRASTEGELMDEKASRLTASIKAITAEVRADPSWDGASLSLLEAAEAAVERAVFAKLYLHVLFPNGDGDIARDQVLSEHIRRLSACTTAAGAGVAPRHLWAAPFPRAQRHLRRMCVARAPRDKVSCIMRCVTCVMAVLGLTEGSAPAADDLTPVLVYIILRVNPPSLLSTIELVNALGAGSLTGEALYWWTHFCAAVAYIKTMDYPRDS